MKQKAYYIAKAIARDQNRSLGRVVGDLILHSSRGAKGAPITMSDYGFPIFRCARPVTTDDVKALDDEIYLLDSNVLIALATPEHSLNARAVSWFRKGHRFATCPITQGAPFRFHLRAGMDATAESAKLLLETISSLPRHEFWTDDVSYLDVPTTGIAGHRQVTDAYLVLLAHKRGGSLATMDQALATVRSGTTLLA